MDIRQYITDKAADARQGARSMARASSDQKNRMLLRMAEAFRDRSAELIEANGKDVEFGAGKGLSKALLDRLTLNDKRIADMAQGLVEVAALADPSGEIVKMWRRPNGMEVGRMRAHRRYRNHIRIASQCNGRRREPMSEGRQCGHPQGRV
jgi:glutamate-5-semialdehyde dehydrogenase